MNDPAVQFDQVWRRFDDQVVLQGLEFCVGRGEVFALLGRNGTGKTTAIRILLGLLSPHAGSSRVLGVESRALGARERARLGYVGEGHRLYPTLSVRDTIAFEAETRERFRRDWAERARNAVGLPERRPVFLLSRGQRAQLALILAIASEPDVLICDDPALGLDPVMRRQFLDVMVDLLSGRGTTVLFSSHVMTDVERIADRVGILDQGRLIVDARLDDLKTRVQKRVWQGRNGAAGSPPSVEGLLNARARHGRFELTLLDLDEAREAELREGGAELTDERVVPSLEELFIDLTAGDSRGPRIPAIDDFEIAERVGDESLSGETQGKAADEEAAR